MLERKNTPNAAQTPEGKKVRVAPSTKGMRGRWKNPKSRERMVGGRPEFQKASDAQILRPFLLEGKSPEEIGDALGYKASVSNIEGRQIRRNKPIRKRLKKILGFHELRLLHGDPMNHEWFPVWRGNFGEPSHKELAPRLGVGERHVWNSLRDTGHHDLLTADFCEKIRQCEQTFIDSLMSHRGRGESHFKAIVPDLRDRLRVASDAIARFRELIDKPENAQAQTLNELAKLSRQQLGGVGKDKLPAREILCLLPTLIPWLNANQAEFEKKPKEIAVLFLAHDFGVKVHVVHNAAYSSKVRASAGGEIRALLFPIGAGVAPPQKSPKAQRPPKKIPDWMIQKGNRCIQITKEVRMIHQRATEGLSIAEIKAEHPEFAVWDIRDAMPEDQRSAFNHPRQWGKPIGYAKIILGREQSVSRFTIADWMKAARKTKRSA